jgi:hypothetical protein
MKTLAKNWSKLAAFAGVLGALLLLVTSLVWADVPQPVIRISALGSNQFSITVTNGVTNSNYELHWTPVLSHSNYPWQLVASGALGETNWIRDGGTWQSGFFRVSTGNDTDGDGILNWQDADPSNPSVGILTITIESPIGGSTIN